MSTQIGEIRRALTASLDGLDVQVFPGRSDYDQTGGFDTLRFIARIIAGPANDPASADRLDALLSPGPESAKERLEDTDLGPLGSSVAVTRSSGYLNFPGDPQQLGAELTVEVLA